MNPSQQTALVQSFTARRPTVAERLAAGKALRETVPRASHADYRKPTNRVDPVEILEQQNKARVEKLVPVRYARMLVSPFAFLRGSAAVAVEFQGGDDAGAENAARTAVRSYRKRMRRYAEMGYLETWYDRIDERAVLDAASLKTRRTAERVMDRHGRKATWRCSRSSPRRWAASPASWKTLP